VRLAGRVPGAALLAAPGSLGADWADGLGLDVAVIGPGPETGTARDT
jgi:hypothetical protein